MRAASGHELERALLQVRATIERLRGPAALSDGDLAALLDEARKKASELIDDLDRLRRLVAVDRTDDGRGVN